jgi:hypothetical protein
MGVVIGICVKYPGGPTRMTVTDIRTVRSDGSCLLQFECTSFLSIYHISITNPSCYQELYLLYCTAYQQASAAVDGHGEGKLQYNIMH